MEPLSKRRRVLSRKLLENGDAPSPPASPRSPPSPPSPGFVRGQRVVRGRGGWGGGRGRGAVVPPPVMPLPPVMEDGEDGEAGSVSVSVPLVVPTAEEFKWAFVSQFATGIFPTGKPEARGTTVRVLDTVLSLDAFQSSKWYRDLPLPLDVFSQKNVQRIVEVKVSSLRNLFYDDDDFRKQGFTYLRAWVMFCDRERAALGWRRYALDDPMVVRQFLLERIEIFKEANSTARKKRHVLVEEAVWDSYRKTVSILGRIAKWQEWHSKLTECEEVETVGAAVRLARQKAREGVQNYAVRSRFLGKRFTRAQREKQVEVLWSGEAVTGREKAAAAEASWMRGYAVALLNKVLGRRGMDLRQIRFSMFLQHTLDHVKPAPCRVVGAGIRRIKESNGNEEHLLGWARCADRLACALTALANFVVWRMDVFKSGLFAEMRADLEAGRGATPEDPAGWWEYFLFHGTNEKEEMSYNTHNKDYTGALDAADIKGKLATTHLDRPDVGSRLIERGNCHFSDVGLYQGWHHDVAADKYLKAAFKTLAMLDAAGWDGVKEYFCWWEGEDADIPAALKEAVMPGLDALLARAEEKDCDACAIETLKTFQRLRQVYLEGAVYAREKYPLFPAYRHPVFDLPEWEVYVAAETQRVKDREAAWLYKQRDPALEESFKKHLAESEAAREEQLALMRQMAASVAASAAGGGAGASTSTAAATAATPVDGDEPANKVPRLPDPLVSLAATYDEWRTRLRDFFNSHGRPEWAQFGTRAKGMKELFQKIQPFVRYMDECGDKAEAAIAALEDLRSSRSDVSVSHMIKVCIYTFIQQSRPDSSKPARISAEDIAAALTAAGVPLPNGNCDAMRLRAWAAAGKVRTNRKRQRED